MHPSRLGCADEVRARGVVSILLILIGVEVFSARRVVPVLLSAAAFLINRSGAECDEKRRKKETPEGVGVSVALVC